MPKRLNPIMNEKESKIKPTPAFLRAKYPYSAVGEAITDLDSLNPVEIYEIKCQQCDMAIRSQGKNIRATFEKLSKVGCIGCGNKDLIIQRVDMDSAKKQ